MISEKRRSVITAIVLGMSVVISILFLVYAFIQKAEADVQRITAVHNAALARINDSSLQKTILEKDSVIHVLEKEIETLKKSNTMHE